MRAGCVDSRRGRRAGRRGQFARRHRRRRSFHAHRPRDRELHDGYRAAHLSAADAPNRALLRPRAVGTLDPATRAALARERTPSARSGSVAGAPLRRLRPRGHRVGQREVAHRGLAVDVTAELVSTPGATRPAGIRPTSAPPPLLPLTFLAGAGIGLTAFGIVALLVATTATRTPDAPTVLAGAHLCML